MRLSIKTRIALAISIPLLVIWLFMTWYEYREDRQEALAAMKSYLTELTTRQAAELDVELSNAEQLANTLATVVAFSPSLSEPKVKEWLRKLLHDNPQVFGLGMAFEPSAFAESPKHFAPYYYRDPKSGFCYMDVADAHSELPYNESYQSAKSEGRPAWTEPYFDTEAGGRVMCTYGAPFFRNDQFCGVVTVDVLSKHLRERIRPTNRSQEYSTLISRKGLFISHPDASRIMKPAAFRAAEGCESHETSAAMHGIVAGTTGMCRIVDDRTGLVSWMVYTPVPSAGWSMAAIIPEQQVLAPIHAQLARALAGLLVAGLMMLGIVWLVSIRVTRPINHLTEAAELLARGDLDARVPDVTGTDEVARLARTFNTMVADLKSSVERQIRETAAREEVEGELCAARKIQAALMPPMLPDEPGRPFSLHAVNQPAKAVAGDFFDFFFVDENTLGLVMADVSGKGVPAAIYMAVTRTMLRSFISPEKTPAEVVTRLNRRLARENDDNMFVTLFLGYYDVASGRLTYANAGHNPPYLVRENGQLESLDPTGPLVAPFPDATFDDAQCHLEPRDLAVFFTDGVTEAMSPGGEYYGEVRLESLLKSLTARPAIEVCQRILTTVNEFTCGDLSDDATILVLGRT